MKENTKLNLEEIRAAKTNLESKPVLFNIDLTGRCNIHPPCVFCAEKDAGYQYNAIDISAVDKYLPFLSRCERVTDCSFGEPLTHPDFLKLVQNVAENGQIFTFSTNGLLLTKKRADILAEAGENIGFAVSINAATSATYYKLMGQNFDKIIANIRYFIKKYRDKWGHNPPLAMSFIVMRVNCEEVLDFLKLAHHLGINNINLRHLFSVPDGVRPRNDFGYPFIYKYEMLSPEEYSCISTSSKVLANELGLNLIIHWEAAGSEINSLSVPGVDIPCLFPWKFSFVQEHSKNVYMCCYSNAVLGSVNTHSLEQIWNGDLITQVRKELVSGKVPEFCKIHGLSCPLVLADERILKESETNGVARHKQVRKLDKRLRQSDKDPGAPSEQIQKLTKLLYESEADRAARRKQLQQLSKLLHESEADRAARLKQVQKLTKLLHKSEADRAARLEQNEEIGKHLSESEKDRRARFESNQQLTELLYESEADRAARWETILKLEERLTRSEADRAALQSSLEQMQATLAFRVLRKMGYWDAQKEKTGTNSGK